jgi:hypothetical protein
MHRGRQHFLGAGHTALGVADQPVRTDEVNSAVHHSAVRVVECGNFLIFVH